MLPAQQTHRRQQIPRTHRLRVPRSRHNRPRQLQHLTMDHHPPIIGRRTLKPTYPLMRPFVSLPGGVPTPHATGRARAWQTTPARAQPAAASLGRCQLTGFGKEHPALAPPPPASKQALPPHNAPVCPAPLPRLGLPRPSPLRGGNTPAAPRVTISHRQADAPRRVTPHTTARTSSPPALTTMSTNTPLRCGNCSHYTGPRPNRCTQCGTPLCPACAARCDTAGRGPECQRRQPTPTIEAA